jgi:beta-lactam-binding protein with PASTA domain
VRKFGIYATTAVGATAVSMAFFGAGIASADDYAGQTYSDAKAAISTAGKKAVVSSRAGDTLPDDKCIVTHSQAAPWIKGDQFKPDTKTVLVNLNCNATVASAKDPGNSAGSPEGRAAIKAAATPSSGGSGG